MTKAVVFEIDEWQEFKREIREDLRAELTKVRSEVVEAPMTRKEVAKFLKCDVQTVSKNWSHLRHVVNGTPYWFKDELTEFIKKQ
jgi:DNA invertase Pin-like site-specific DNA recombinase